MFSSIFLYLFHLNLYDDYDETFSHYQEQLQEQLRLAEESEWENELFLSALRLSLTQEKSSIFIYDESGQLLLEPEKPEVPEVTLDEGIIQSVLKGEQFAEGSRIDRHFVYAISKPIHLSLEHEKEYAMVMFFYELDHQYKQVLFMIFFTFSITISCSALILFVISRKITAPLRDMNRVALQLAKGEFSQKVSVTSKDEIGQLGQTFNYMAKELEGLEQMRRDFISSVSHDLRSPLTSIKGFLVALLDGTIPNERKPHYYTIMKSETERLIKLVNDLLEMSQLESGHITLKRSTYNISEQIRLLIAKLEPQVIKHNVEVELLSPENDVSVFADANRIEQVMMNLIENAIHFSHPASKVIVRLKQVDQNLMISIEDCGEGIKPEELPLIWERFFKSDQARTKKVGTGIGLAIVKTIIDLHETTIDVKSTLGEGSVFTFTLPMSRQ